MGFKKGESGNPTGRPKGCKDKRTRLIESVVAATTEFALTMVLFSDSPEQAHRALDLIREQMGLPIK